MIDLLFCSEITTITQKAQTKRLSASNREVLRDLQIELLINFQIGVPTKSTPKPDRRSSPDIERINDEQPLDFSPLPVDPMMPSSSELYATSR